MCEDKRRNGRRFNVTEARGSREEVYRDKGVDLDIELKYNYKYTNFRFIVQLKATDAIEENSDGSYSTKEIYHH